MTTLRSEDWSVRPSFVPNGPTSPVTLLCDEAGLTQLAGIPSVAWQTPWSEIANVELVRFSHQMALFGTVDGVRYCWRHRQVNDFEAMRAVVLEHGGVVSQRRRRAGVVAVVAAVLAASFAGGIAAWLSRTSANSELTAARAANVTLRDLPSGWYATSSGVLSYLVPPSTQVIVNTPTTAPPRNGVFDKAAALFQGCLGVTNTVDRVYGLAGQQPDYQVSSQIFDTNTLGGIELATTSQYYHTTTMVRRDSAEMRKFNFGKCFAASSAALIDLQDGAPSPALRAATNWQPRTFVTGFSRGGVAPLLVPGAATGLHLVMVVVTHGHFEITLSAMVGSFTKSAPFLSTVVSTLLARATSSTSTAA